MKEILQRRIAKAETRLANPVTSNIAEYELEVAREMLEETLPVNNSRSLDASESKNALPDK